jgi:hypothetical protein
MTFFFKDVGPNYALTHRPTVRPLFLPRHLSKRSIIMLHVDSLDSPMKSVSQESSLKGKSKHLDVTVYLMLPLVT